MTKSKEIGEYLGGEFYGDKADGVYVILDVTIENVGKQSDYFTNSYIKLIDNQGREYEHNPEAETYLGVYHDESNFLLTQLQPNLPKEGKIVFDVPYNFNGKIELSGGWITEKKYILLT